jgi:hypothetical protein
MFIRSDLDYKQRLFYIMLNVVLILMTLLVIYVDVLVIFKFKNIEVHELSIVPIDTQILLISITYTVFMLYRIIYMSIRPIYSKSMYVVRVISAIILIALNMYVAFTHDIHIVHYHIILLLTQIALTGWSIYLLTFTV